MGRAAGAQGWLSHSGSEVQQRGGEMVLREQGVEALFGVLTSEPGSLH